MYLPLSTIVHDRIATFRHAAVTNGQVPPLAIVVLRALIANVWSRDTADPDVRSQWTADKPWLGQSDVTALVVEKVIMHADVVRMQLPNEARPHYFNVIRDFAVDQWGPEPRVDLSRGIVESNAPGTQVTGVSRIELLDSGDGRNHQVRARYDLLKRRLRQG